MLVSVQVGFLQEPSPRIPGPSLPASQPPSLERPGRLLYEAVEEWEVLGARPDPGVRALLPGTPSTPSNYTPLPLTPYKEILVCVCGWCLSPGSPWPVQACLKVLPPCLPACHKSPALTTSLHPTLYNGPKPAFDPAHPPCEGETPVSGALLDFGGKYGT